ALHLSGLAPLSGEVGAVRPGMGAVERGERKERQPGRRPAARCRLLPAHVRAQAGHARRPARAAAGLAVGAFHFRQVCRPLGQDADQIFMMGQSGGGLAELKTNTGQQRSGPRILVVRNDKIGDFMLAWPALALLRRSLPDAHISVLVPGYTRALAQRCPWID